MILTASRDFTVQRCLLADADPDFLRALRRIPDAGADPIQNPDWLAGYFDPHEVEIYSFYSGEAFSGAAPFVKRAWPMQWHLGEIRIGRFPLNRLRLIGGRLDAPVTAYDTLFSELARRTDIDCVYLEEVPEASSLWEYLQTSPLIKESYVRYQPEPASFRPILRFEGSFDQYMQKFAPKHRKNIRREIRRLRDGALGNMELLRYERPEDVDRFLEQAIEISKKTYQWRIYDRGLSATEKIRRRLLFAAEHGWMRSYLLSCGGRALAFATGYQHGGSYFLDEIGHDPEFDGYSLGTVLQFLMVEDLFDYNRPLIWDFQDYGAYKETLSTEMHSQCKLFLFRRNSYGRFLAAGHRASYVINRAIAARLERWGLRGRVKKLLRRRAAA